MSDDIPSPLDAFKLAEEGEYDPRPVAEQLIDECAEFGDLRAGEVTIMFVFRMEEKVKAGKSILGELALPKFGGALAAFGGWLLAVACQGIMPDFLMILDRAWWEAATPYQRRALVHHELKHAKHAEDKEGEFRFTDAGLPVWELRAHDIEEFDDTVRRFGHWRPDITRFVDAANAGGSNSNPINRRY